MRKYQYPPQAAQRLRKYVPIWAAGQDNQSALTQTISLSNQKQPENYTFRNYSRFELATHAPVLRKSHGFVIWSSIGYEQDLTLHSRLKLEIFDARDCASTDRVKLVLSTLVSYSNLRVSKAERKHTCMSDSSVSSSLNLWA